MLLFGIIGHPLTHTLSPTIHNWAFRDAGIQASYHLWDTPPEKLPAFVSALRTLPIHGVSVTIPHKEAIVPFVDALTAGARGIGAVNTLYWEQQTLWGDNTDVTGFMAPLQDQHIGPGTALILGAGGAARAAVWGLREAGWQVRVSSRTESRANRLGHLAGATPIPWKDRHDFHPDLLVNTTPLGMSGPFQNLSPWKHALSGISLVYDLVYNPKTTPLLAQAQREGIPVIHGLPMFAAQAQAQFARWTGRTFPLPTAIALLEGCLATRNNA